MSGNVVPFTGKTLLPMHTELRADNVRASRADFYMCQMLILKAQELGQKALRGEVTPPDRANLTEALVVLGVRPKPPQPS